MLTFRLEIDDLRTRQGLFEVLRTCAAPSGARRVVIRDDPETIAAVFIQSAAGDEVLSLQAPGGPGEDSLLLRAGKKISSAAPAEPPR